ncbi:hypothetical protein [Neolewinella antarctica]|uniref:Lipocalin-like domain-containing protein n=1 Tax=Neolewinella antarctica TaxID=442734 RepID=A0ABX0XF53_9BACT|nr:hypothetical protein [Neolewinella antarctica]NJC27408.1 hypothetical protein [Neolewinella antarctica]
MKPRHFLYPLFICLLAFTACEDDEDPLVFLDPDPTTPMTLTGQWQLIEVLADPGDGSGTFQPVTSSRTIEFLTDSTYQSNSIICEFTTETNSLTVLTDGKFNLDELLLSPEDCRNVPPLQAPLGMSFADGDLILEYLCIEPCLQKFRKL